VCKVSDRNFTSSRLPRLQLTAFRRVLRGDERARRPVECETRSYRVICRIDEGERLVEIPTIDYLAVLYRRNGSDARPVSDLSHALNARRS